MLFIHMIAGFGIAILSGMGVGSAGLFVLYLTMFAGTPQTEAQGLNLVFFLLSAGAAFLYHFKKRRVEWGQVLLLILFALPGSLAGAALMKRLDAATVRRLFGGMLTLAGGWSLLQERSAARGAERR